MSDPALSERRPGTMGAVTGERNETDLERLDRHWIELLQEVRVVQTGVQLLTGFLLVLPFQDRFYDLSGPGRAVYLVTVSLAALSTACLITPVAMHRFLCRHGARPVLVEAAQRFALAGLALLGLAIVGVLMLTFGMVLGRDWGIVAGGVALVIFGALWLVFPLVVRRSFPCGPASP